MFNHITPPSGGSDHTEQAAEPPNSRRFADQRGIALQTIIILVVLLAIAGAVVVVIANRAAEETSRLENQDADRYAGIATLAACELAGGRPSSAGPPPVAFADLNADRDNYSSCHPPG